MEPSSLNTRVGLAVLAVVASSAVLTLAVVLPLASRGGLA
jgi:hypothetical protein